MTIFGALLAIVGAWGLRRRPLVASGLLLTAFGIFPFALSYWALADTTKYFLPAIWIASLLCGLGAQILDRHVRKTRMRSFPIGAAILLILIALNCGNNASAFLAQRSDRSAEAIISSARLLTPDNATIATPWWYATPLFYAAYVEHSLGNRRIVTNVTHNDLVRLAQAYPVYYFPLPANDIDIAGAVLHPVPNGWPAMYSVTLPRRQRTATSEASPTNLAAVRKDYTR